MAPNRYSPSLLLSLSAKTLSLGLFVLCTTGCTNSSPNDNPTKKHDTRQQTHSRLNNRTSSPPDGPWAEMLKQKKRIAVPLDKMNPAPPRQKGIVLGLYSEDPDWSYEPLLQEIADTGASHVSLVIAYYLDTVHSTEIKRHPRFTARERTLIKAIRDAKSKGLDVLLFPILRVTEKPTPLHWRGNLMPKNREKLQTNYKNLMSHLANIAQKENIYSMSIGSELSTLDTDIEWFRPIAQAVRKGFSGRLIYSGNWDHFKNVKIWPLVDELGVCGYFGLTSKKSSPPLHELISGWRNHRSFLDQWAARQGKKLVFTEVGYMSQQGASREPWNEGAKQPVDLDEQYMAYEAFARVWNNAPLLEGVYFWNWYGWGGARDHSYTPRRKPAAKIISWWYGGSRDIDWWFPR